MAQQEQEAQTTATADLLWGRRTGPTRGPKPALTVERIAETAVAVADAEGIEAVSMQRIAASLDFTKMSLYRYVAGKADLVAAMTEQAIGDPPDLSRVRGGWRPRAERWAKLLSASWEDHPWLPGVTVGHRVIGPREAGWTEALVAALDDTPLTPAERMDLASVLSGHLRNTQAIDVAGTQPWHDARHVALVREHSDRFPALAETTRHRARSPRQTRDFGLQCLLDGVELRIAERSR
jgi:AcrR family transcriptional regulator